MFLRLFVVRPDWSVVAVGHMICDDAITGLAEIGDEVIDVSSSCLSPDADPQGIDCHLSLHSRGQQEGRGPGRQGGVGVYIAKMVRNMVRPGRKGARA